MNLLGFDIDIDFAWSIGPVIIEESIKDGYWIFFELKLKDGRSHKVEINNNFYLQPYRGQTLVMNKKDLTARQQKQLDKRKPEDIDVIKKLRMAVIKEKNRGK